MSPTITGEEEEEELTRYIPISGLNFSCLYQDKSFDHAFNKSSLEIFHQFSSNCMTTDCSFP